MTNLDERTKVPFVWVAVSIPFFIGGIFWLASVDSKASEARDIAADSKQDLTQLSQMMTDVRERVIRIEEHQKRSYDHNPKGEK